jgi:hypothetical protein
MLALSSRSHLPLHRHDRLQQAVSTYGEKMHPLGEPENLYMSRKSNAVNWEQPAFGMSN